MALSVWHWTSLLTSCSIRASFIPPAARIYHFPYEYVFLVYEIQFFLHIPVPINNIF